MTTRSPGRSGVTVNGAVGVPALIVSVLVALQGMALYTGDNSGHCGGGLGRIGPALFLYAVLALALLATLVTLVLALVVAIASRRWAWIVGLVAATAVGALFTVGANSQVSHTLVGSVLGFGCSWYWPEVARCLAPAVVAVPCLVCLMTRRRRE